MQSKYKQSPEINVEGAQITSSGTEKLYKILAVH